MRFLIDECLTPQLTIIAHAAGFEAVHVARIGLAGTKDWDLLPVIIDGDWTFVTKNSADFRGRADAPGEPGLHAQAAIHAGLICLNGQPGMDYDDHQQMFEAALDVLGDAPDLTNQVLEITDVGPDEDYVSRRYELVAAEDAR